MHIYINEKIYIYMYVYYYSCILTLYNTVSTYKYIIYNIICIYEYIRINYFFLYTYILSHFVLSDNVNPYDRKRLPTLYHFREISGNVYWEINAFQHAVVSPVGGQEEAVIISSRISVSEISLEYLIRISFRYPSGRDLLISSILLSFYCDFSQDQEFALC